MDKEEGGLHDLKEYPRLTNVGLRKYYISKSWLGGIRHIGRTR